MFAIGNVEVEVEVVWEPAWNIYMANEHVKEKLGMN